MEKINELANNYKKILIFFYALLASVYIFLIIYCYYNLISLIKKVKQLISIIIPTYNSGKTINRAIKSVINQNIKMGVGDNRFIFK